MNWKNTISSIKLKQWLNTYDLSLTIAIIISILEMALCKFFYPYPNFLPDSYSYLEAAIRDQEINMWPIGYSKFLVLFKPFTHSHECLVWLQYFLLLFALLYFLYTIWRLFNPKKEIYKIILFITLLNPLSIQLCNFVSSDALFATLSLLWATQLLWIGNSPKLKLLLFHALIVAIAFSVRYNALYYPLISIGVICFTKMDYKAKLIGIATTVLLTTGFIGFTQYHYKNKTGRVQFSAFGGWQLASNALSVYEYVPKYKRVKVKPKFERLHTIVNKHVDSLREISQIDHTELSVYYLWDNKSPLKQYMNQNNIKNNVTSWFIKWATMAPFYKKYGILLIQKYPLEYVKYFLLPNLINYYMPKSEFLGVYNMGITSIDKTGVAWFKLNSAKVFNRSNSTLLNLNIYVSLLFAISNLLFIPSFIAVMLSNRINKELYVNAAISRCAFTVWCFNLLFSVLVSPVVLRYQLFPMIITIAFLLIFISLIIDENRKKLIEPSFGKLADIKPEGLFSKH